MKNKFIPGRNRYQRTVYCSCGSEAKERIKRNYPFGKRSKFREISDYFCLSCGKKQ